MAEADLSPTTFTSSSTSDSDYDISPRIPLKMKTKINTLKLPLIIIIRTPKAMQSLKSAGVRRCQNRSTGSSCHPVELIKLLSSTENTLQKMAACLFSRRRRSKGHEQELRKELLQSPRIGIENYPSRASFI